MIDIDASKGFVDVWVHLSFAIFAIFDLKRQLKLLEMARNAQWVHLFSMDFDDHLPYFLV